MGIVVLPLNPGFPSLDGDVCLCLLTFGPEVELTMGLFTFSGDTTIGEGGFDVTLATAATTLAG